MAKKCKHKSIKRKMILAGKREGMYTAYCSQQCKKMKKFDITTDDIREVFPNYKKEEQ